MVLAYATREIEDLVKIDDCHAAFLKALVMCKKPRHVLEFGFGAGEGTRAIRAGLQFNAQAHHYTVVDNWLDFGGQQPAATRDEDFGGVGFVTSSELDFVVACKQTYDFILSDADHHNTQSWFEPAYTSLLARGGVLVYHDVTNAAAFPNLMQIYEDCIRRDLHHVLLNRNSLPGERCDRGLLVIFKH
jgi:predicted O-methyltransferase YrrM